jgi:hypothetical protein
MNGADDAAPGWTVTLERGGGFAGIANHQRLGPMRLRDLPPDERDRAVELIASWQASCDAGSAAPTARSATRDGMWFQIELCDEHGARRVRWSQHPPSELDALFRLLAAHGTWRRA